MEIYILPLLIIILNENHFVFDNDRICNGNLYSSIINNHT